MEQVGQQWTVRMADAPEALTTTRLITADLLGISAVVEHGQPTHYTAILNVQGMGCPVEVTCSLFCKLAELVELAEVQHTRVVLSRLEAGQHPFTETHGMFSSEVARDVANRVMREKGWA